MVMIYTTLSKNVIDTLFEKLNYHHNINLSIETNPKKFLNTEIVDSNGVKDTKVFRKPTKQSVPCASNLPKRYKRNTNNADLY